MRVLVVTHYYAPEFGAPQTRLRESARLLAQRGWEVRILTTHPHYPDGMVRDGYRALSIQREEVDGVRVLRLPVLARPNTGFLNRVIDQASFAFTAAAAIGPARWADVLLVESPPLFLGTTGHWLKKKTGSPYVLHVADPWPDYPIEMGALRFPGAVWLARALERNAYAGAGAITTPTTGCAALIEQQPAARGKVEVIPNSVDVGRFDVSRRQEDARRTLGWQTDRPTYVYVGTVGLAQGLETLVRGVEMVAGSWRSMNRSPIVRIVGDGIERQRLEASARPLADILTFHGALSGDAVPDVAAAADVLIVLLKRGKLAEVALPTKLVEGMAAGRPVLLSANGESASIVQRNGAGIVVPAEDAEALAGALMSMHQRADLDNMARRGRAAAERTFSRAAAIQHLDQVLRAVVAGS